uniref:Uncharacterized protein n=1 Tax=Rhizophora mucronata TaxID=61149 RepID=A0A2P2QPM4_RHIMU
MNMTEGNPLSFVSLPDQISRVFYNTARHGIGIRNSILVLDSEFFLALTYLNSE